MVVMVVVRMMEEGMGTSQNSMKNGMRKQHLNSCPNIWTRNIFLNHKLLKNKMRFQCFQSLGSFWGWLEWKAWGQCVCSQHELWRTARESPPLPLQNRRITHFQVWREDSNDFHWLWTKNKLGACKKSKQKSQAQKNVCYQVGGDCKLHGVMVKPWCLFSAKFTQFHSLPPYF